MAGLALAISLGVGLSFGAEWGWTAAAILLFAVVHYHVRNVRAIERWLEHGEATAS